MNSYWPIPFCDSLVASYIGAAFGLYEMRVYQLGVSHKWSEQ